MEFRDIKRFLKNIKSKLILEYSLISGLQFYILILLSSFSFYFLFDFIRYLSISILSTISLIAFIYYLMKVLYKQRFYFKKDWYKYLIEHLPEQFKHNEDYLRNSVDISEKQNVTDLEVAYLEKGKVKLNESYKLMIPKKLIHSALILSCLLIVFSFSQNFQSYMKHQWLNNSPEIQIFLSLEKKTLELKEDSVYSISFNHNIPDLNEMILIVLDKDSVNFKYFNINYTKGEFELPGISYDSGFLRLQAKSNFFGDINSNSLAFNKIKTFKINSHNVVVKPPKYTGLKPYIAANYKSLDILKGSLIQWSLDLNKTIVSSTSNFNKINDLSFSKRLHSPIVFYSKFTDKDAMELTFKSTKINVIQDKKPLIILRNPTADINVSSMESIPMFLSGIDDFGFKKVNLNYVLIDPLVPNRRDTIAKNVLQNEPAIFQKQINWNVEETNAFPGMDLYYQFIAFDNNAVDGSSSHKTEWQKIHFLSMDELFLQVQKEQEEISKEVLENMNERNEIVKDLEKLQRKLKQKGDLSFDEKKQIDNLLSKLEELNNKLNNAQKKIEELEKKAEKNNVFSEELVSEFNQLKELLKSLNLMQKKQNNEKPATSMNSNELKKELDNVTKSEDEMKKELERFKKLLDKLKEKQSNEKTLAQLKDFENKQNAINKQLENDEKSSDRNQQKLEKEMTLFKEKLDDQSKLKQNISDKKIIEDMKKSQNQQREKKSETREQIEESIKALKEEQQQKMEDEQNAEKEALLKKVDELIQYLLQNSFQQEELVKESNNVSVYSDQFKPFIRDQNIVKSQLEFIKRELVAISGETFLFNPKTINVVDNAIEKIDAVIDDLEQRRQNEANRNQGEILGHINQSILMLNTNQQSMQSSESALGEKEFQKQMESMSKEQQGLNSQSESLWDMLKKQAQDQELSEKGKLQQKGQGEKEGDSGKQGDKGQPSQQGSNGQQSGLGDMQSDLADRMKELLDKAGKNGGGANGGNGRNSALVEEMKKLANELKANRLNEKLIERQKKLLQKMLDASNSGKEKKEKTKKREKEVAKDFDIVDIKKLDDNLGQLNALINQYYERAINKKYDSHIKKMIQNYFDNLINSQTDSLQILNK